MAEEEFYEEILEESFHEEEEYHNDEYIEVIEQNNNEEDTDDYEISSDMDEEMVEEPVLEEEVSPSSGGKRIGDFNDLKYSYHDDVDATPGETPLPKAKGKVSLVMGELIILPSLGGNNNSLFSSDEENNKHSFFDETETESNNGSVPSDTEINEGEYEEEDSLDEAEYNQKLSGTEDLEFTEYAEYSYRSVSSEEVTVEDALATIMEEEEEEEVVQQEDENKEQENKDEKLGPIQSLYSYSVDNTKYEHPNAASNGSETDDKKGNYDKDANGSKEGDDNNDVINGTQKDQMHLVNDFSATENDEFLANMLKQEDWNALFPFLQELTNKDDQAIRVALKRMDTYGNTRSYPIHFIVWKAPGEFIKSFIGAIPLMYQADALSKLDAYGNTPLHLACSKLQVDESGNMDSSIIEMLFEGSPESLELLNKQGDSSLALLMKSKAMKADPLKMQDVEVKAEALVRRLLNDRIHLIARKNMFDFKTLLHVAAASGVHEKVLIALFELSSSSIARTTDTAGRLPLHYVAGCMSGKRPQATFANILSQTHPAGLVTQTTSGDTPLHIFVSSIHQRVKSKEDWGSETSIKMTELLVGSKEDESFCPLLVTNVNSLSPLHCCALFNTPIHVLKILMKSPFSEMASLITDSNSATPLHLACASSRCKSMIEIIKMFGTKEAALYRDNKSRTPMHVAVENPNMTKDFIKGLAEINSKAAKVKNSKGRMPLHVALRKRAKDSIVKALLKIYPKAVRTIFNGNNSIFHEMCQYKTSASVIKAMLKMYPAGAKMKNKFGNLPLHVAMAYQCSEDVVLALLDVYPGSIMGKNKSGNTPLHYAIENGSEDLIKLLIRTNQKVVSVRNKEGKTPLDRAKEAKIDKGIIDLVKVALKNFEKEMSHVNEESEQNHMLPDTKSPSAASNDEKKVRRATMGKAKSERNIRSSRSSSPKAKAKNMSSRSSSQSESNSDRKSRRPSMSKAKSERRISSRSDSPDAEKPRRALMEKTLSERSLVSDRKEKKITTSSDNKLLFDGDLDDSKAKVKRSGSCDDVQALSERRLRRGGRKSNAFAGKQAEAEESKNAKRRSRSSKRRSSRKSVDTLPSRATGESETQKASSRKARSRSKKRDSMPPSPASSSTVTKESSKSISKKNSLAKDSVIPSSPTTISAYSKKTSPTFGNEVRINSLQLGLEQTPIVESKKFSQSNRATLVDELQSGGPFKGNLPLGPALDEDDI